MQDMAKQISPLDRDQLAVMVGQGKSCREIGKILGFHHTSISREIKRNGWHDTYVAIHAQNLRDVRKVQAGKREPLKDRETYSYVLKHLRMGWSPEVISGRLKRRFGFQVVCPETIYSFIYDPNNKDKRLWAYLPWKRKRRRPKHSRGVNRVRILGRTSIHTRGEEVNSRTQLGHWEADTVIGRQTKGVVIHTAVERKTRYLKANLIPSKQAKATIVTPYQLFKSLPRKLRLSVTTDNGLEFSRHMSLHFLGMKTYFADPYASYQRGTNEQTNGLIRRYLPKGTSFQNLTQEELDDIVSEINNRPKKCLDFQTPKEALQYELAINGAGGAFQPRI